MVLIGSADDAIYRSCLPLVDAVQIEFFGYAASVLLRVQLLSWLFVCAAATRPT